ncbi:MAG TPA: class I SAM-dependent methyltransferase [Solirubrobacteraceae bacterium]|nr:class I SAM-dependent methyltransferase [Solirubrobacteraceae bacterium]
MRTKLSHWLRRLRLSPWAGHMDGTPTAASARPDYARHVAPGQLGCEDGLVSGLLFSRLGSDIVEAVEAEVAAKAELAPLLDQVRNSGDSVERRRIVLALGMWLGIAAISERTGLTATRPPAEIHAMARGPLAAAGGLYEADMVIGALVGCGVSLNGLRTALDFGCSSGRVVRVLSAAYPQVDWYGCDPNRDAVKWGEANVNGVRFFESPQQPPLELGTGELDLVYAISIWSHFDSGLGLRWFEEMHRLLSPGGHLVITTHGLASIPYYAQLGSRNDAQLSEIKESLYETGTWFEAEFGLQGDWGIVNPAWGSAFVSPEWILANLCPKWRVLEFAPGRNQNNQDLYVLQRP